MAALLQAARDLHGLVGAKSTADAKRDQGHRFSIITLKNAG
jgi:hypothetical protein